MLLRKQIVLCSHTPCLVQPFIFFLELIITLSFHLFDSHCTSNILNIFFPKHSNICVTYLQITFCIRSNILVSSPTLTPIPRDLSPRGLCVVCLHLGLVDRKSKLSSICCINQMGQLSWIEESDSITCSQVKSFSCGSVCDPKMFYPIIELEMLTLNKKH